MSSNNAKTTPNNAVSNTTNANAQSMQNNATQCDCAWNPVVEEKWIVTQTQYTCGIMPDGGIGVYKIETETIVFDIEKEANKFAQNVIAAQLLNYGVKDWESKIIEQRPEINLPTPYLKKDEFGYILSKNGNATTYNMFDTRGDFPCDFVDVRVEPKQFFYSRASAQGKKLKTDFDVDYFFKDEKKQFELEERKKTIEEFKKLLKGE